ncbi:MAG: sigma 54-interacting transcriptional regulator [Acidobacteriaceae bacterium]|nr:sigma 54-interacting transcriptional regulator [Acidobacteriaceae bacterium]
MAIVLSMMAADAIAIWQFTRTAAPNRRLAQADQTSLSVLRVQLDLSIFRESLTALASTHGIRQFTIEATAVRQKFVEDVARSAELLGSASDTEQDPAIRSALETLRIMLPSQLDTAVELASAGDWAAVSLRLRDQVQDLVDVSSLLVEKVDREVSQQRAAAIESGRRAQRQLTLVLPITALLTLLVAVALGWYATQSITHPLSKLEAAARALAQGDFQHQVAIRGEDELAQLGQVFNDTTQRLAALYETLRTNEARLRLTIDTIPAYVWSALPDGSVDFINQRWLEFSGLSLEQGLGWGWEAAIHPEDRADFVEKWREAIESGKAMETEARVRRADGQYRWLLIRNVPLRDETGKIVKWYGKSSDIDDRKRAEEELRAAETRFRAFVDHATDALFVHDEQGLIVDVNRRACESLGYTREELIGMSPFQFDAALDEVAVQRLVERSRSGENVAFESLHRRKDGIIFPVEVNSRSFWFGDRRFALSLARDITDRKRAEEALHRSESYLAEAQRLSHTGSWALNPRTQQYSYWSDEMHRIWGLNPRNGVPDFETVRERLHPEDRERVLESLNRTLREEKDTADEYRIVLPDGAVKHIYTRRHPVFNSTGQLVEYVGTTMDVTEQYRSRAALEKAFEEIQELKDQLYKENLALREEVVRASMFEEIVGASKPLETVLSQVAKVAPTDSTVLITGETGTGKELIARAIHKRSQRSGRAFVSVNCAALAPSLISSELFGYEKGAFTGATQRHIGRFELADGGTIFLDEVGELPPETQVSLLRVLQEREFERVGGTQSIRVDVRVIAATNRDLTTAIANRSFRQDLFYRFNVFPIAVPPLRDRKEDVLMLVEYFVQRYAIRANKNIRSIGQKTLDLFQSYDWPGNVRELQNVVERSVILTTGDVLRVDESWFSQESSEPPFAVQAPSPLAAGQRQEREIIEAALAESRGRVSGPSGAAARLRVPRSTLESRIRALKINKSQFKFGSRNSS